MELKYKNHSRNGLKNNHKYVVKIYPPSKGIYVYNIEFIYDITDQEEMELWLQYASKISINNNFDYEKFETES